MMCQALAQFLPLRLRKRGGVTFLDDAIEKAVSQLQAFVGTERGQLVDEGLVHGINLMPEWAGANGPTH